MSKYTFTISVPNSYSVFGTKLGLHVRNIEFVGAAFSTVQMVPVKDGDYCVKAGTQLSERHGVRHQQFTHHACLVGTEWPTS